VFSGCGTGESKGKRESQPEDCNCRRGRVQHQAGQTWAIARCRRANLGRDAEGTQLEAANMHGLDSTRHKQCDNTHHTHDGQPARRSVANLHPSPSSLRCRKTASKQTTSLGCANLFAFYHRKPGNAAVQTGSSSSCLCWRAIWPQSSNLFDNGLLDTYLRASSPFDQLT